MDTDSAEDDTGGNTLDDEQIAKRLDEIDAALARQLCTQEREQLEALRRQLDEVADLRASNAAMRAEFETERAAWEARRSAKLAELGIDAPAYLAASEEERSEMLRALLLRAAVERIEEGLLVGTGRERLDDLKQAISEQAKAINSFRKAGVSRETQRRVFEVFDHLAWNFGIEMPPHVSAVVWVALLVQHMSERPARGWSARSLRKERGRRNEKYRDLERALGTDGANTAHRLWDALMLDAITEISLALWGPGTDH